MCVVGHVVNRGVLRVRHDWELEHRAPRPDLGLGALAERCQVGDLGAQALVVRCQGRVRLVKDTDRDERGGSEETKDAISVAQHGHPATHREEPEEADDHEDSGPGSDLWRHEQREQGPEPTDYEERNSGQGEQSEHPELPIGWLDPLRDQRGHHDHQECDDSGQSNDS